MLTIPIDLKRGARVTVDIHIDLIETFRLDDQAPTVAFYVQSRARLSGKNLSAVFDKVHVATEDIVVRHFVGLTGHACVLDKRAIRIRPTYRTAHRYSEADAGRQFGKCPLSSADCSA